MILIRYLGVNNKQTRKKSGIIVWLAVLVEAPSQWQCGLIFLFFLGKTRASWERASRAELNGRREIIVIIKKRKQKQYYLRLK